MVSLRKFISKHRKTVVLTFLPVAFLLISARVIYLRYLAPGHTHWADPDYAYLMNGLTIAKGLAPWHVEHPGTSLQTLNALFALVVWNTDLLGTRDSTLTNSVLGAPETHLILISCSAALLIAAALFVLGLRMVRHFGLSLSVVAQTSPLILGPFLGEGLGSLFGPILLGNRPEPFIFALITFALALLAPRIADATYSNMVLAAPLILGLLIGLTISMKLSSFASVILLPLIFWKPKPILIAYLTSFLSLGLLLLPIWTRLPASVQIWKTWNSYAQNPLQTLSEIPSWLPTLILRDFTFIGVSLLLTLLAVLLSLVYGKKPCQKRNQGLYLFLGVAFLSVGAQLVLSERWTISWISVAAPSVAMAISAGLLLISRTLIFPISKRKRLGKLVPLLVFAGILLISLFSFANLLSSSKPSNDFLTLKSNEALVRGVVVYDYSLTWSFNSVVSECISLVNGDAFARAVAFSEIQARCPGVWLAGFSESGIQPMTPLSDRDSPQNALYALYCEDLSKLVTKAGGLFIVTPARDFDYIKSETVIEEGGWRLSRVDSTDCAASPVRDERPNPATAAARERISRLPVIGPIYRNWPFKDSIT